MIDSPSSAAARGGRQLQALATDRRRAARRFVKFAIVFVGTLSGSWAVVVALRRIPIVARMI